MHLQKEITFPSFLSETPWVHNVLIGKIDLDAVQRLSDGEYEQQKCLSLKVKGWSKTYITISLSSFIMC